MSRRRNFLCTSMENICVENPILLVSSSMICVEPYDTFVSSEEVYTGGCNNCRLVDKCVCQSSRYVCFMSKGIVGNGMYGRIDALSVSLSASADGKFMRTVKRTDETTPAHPSTYGTTIKNGIRLPRCVGTGTLDTNHPCGKCR